MSFVYGLKFINRFYFDNNAIGNKQINTKPLIQVEALIMNRNWPLALKLDSSKLEFTAKARFVNRLKEPGTKGTMYLECRVYDIASNCIGFLRYR